MNEKQTPMVQINGQAISNNQEMAIKLMHDVIKKVDDPNYVENAERILKALEYICKTILQTQVVIENCNFYAQDPKSNKINKD